MKPQTVNISLYSFFISSMSMKQRQFKFPPFFYFLCERLDDHLAQTLTGPHYISGINRLICWYENKSFTSIQHRRVSRFISSDGIVFYRFTGAVLHQRHMLMGCGVIHNLRLILTENLENALTVPDGPNQCHQVQIWIVFTNLLLDVIGIIFVYIKNN